MFTNSINGYRKVLERMNELSITQPTIVDKIILFVRMVFSLVIKSLCKKLKVYRVSPPMFSYYIN